VNGRFLSESLIRGKREELDRLAAQEVGAALSEVAYARGHAILAVVGGRSVAGVFAHLAALELPWRKIHIFMADERMLPISSPESNWQVVDAALVAPLLQSGRLLPEHVHPFRWEEGAADGGVSLYAAELQKWGGRFDVAVLSAGEDGHTASLFPHHPAILTTDRLFLEVDNAPKPPPRRITASRGLLELAGLAVLMVYGGDKRKALGMLEEPSLSLADCPAKLVGRCPRGLVYTDLL